MFPSSDTFTPSDQIMFLIILILGLVILLYTECDVNAMSDTEEIRKK